MGGRLWTVKEELYVKKYYNTKSISEIAKVLKRSYNAVQRKAERKVRHKGNIRTRAHCR